MRVFRKEFVHDYLSYSFGYTEYGELESSTPPHTAYEHGFLPESKDPDQHNRFYMARSVRVSLGDFSLTSENRRITKKFDGVFARDILTREELQSDSDFRTCFLTYFAKRHGNGVMSEDRLEGILQSALPIRGVRYSQNKVPVGYIIEVYSKTFIHYWYSCYDLKHVNTSLGMWLMINSIQHAKQDGCTHAYLGTAYGNKGRYKMNFPALEFWNGNVWVNDTRALKELLEKDAHREISLLT